MKKKLMLVLGFVVLACAANAEIINIMMHNGDTTFGRLNNVPDGNLVSAGTNGSDTWNNINRVVDTLVFSDKALDLSDGTSSGATLDVASGFSHYVQVGTSNDDQVMMTGWYGINSTESFTVSGLSSAFTGDGYEVTIYGDVAGDRVMDYTIGSTTKTINDVGNFDGTFVEGERKVTFSGLTSSSFTITGNVTGRSAISGIIISKSLPADSLPVIHSFTTSDTNVLSGSEVTLAWEVEATDSLSIDQGIGDVPVGSGSTQVVVNADTTYTLKAINSYGTNTASVSVTLDTALPTIQTFRASSTNVFPGATEVSLFWSVSDETGVSINQGIGYMQDSEGSTQIVVAASATYTLTATNFNGSVSESIDILLNESPVLFRSDFDGNTGAYIFTGVADNISGSATLGITDWTTDASVTAISGLTAITTNGVGGFAQTQGGTSTYANNNKVYLAPNLNVGGNRGFSLTFTIDTPRKLQILKVLSGHSNDSGNVDNGYTSDINFSLSGGTLGIPVTGSFSNQSYWLPPVCHTYDFDLAGTDIGIGSYTLDVYMNNFSGVGSYAIYDGVLLSTYPATNSVTILPSSGLVSGGTEMEIAWISEFGASYIMETNSNLIFGDWQPYMLDILGTGGEITITNPIGPDQTFYRVITE